MSKKLWFKNKTYGWGWTPSTWEGWLVVGVYVALLLTGALWVEDHPVLYASVLIWSTILLIWICYKKGEKPRWRWGK